MTESAENHLPSIKVREEADPNEPVVIISGRDLVGMPHAIAFTVDQLEQVSGDLRQLVVAFRVARAIEKEDAENLDVIQGGGAGV